jgi:hypothetical protein
MTITVRAMARTYHDWSIHDPATLSSVRRYNFRKAETLLYLHGVGMSLSWFQALTNSVQLGFSVGDVLSLTKRSSAKALLPGWRFSTLCARFLALR